MLRFFNMLAIAALVGSAIYAYSIKYETIYYAEQIVKTKHSISREKDAIALLKAEWAHVTRPERVQALSEKYLELAPMALTQVVQMKDLPEKAPKVDAIGRKLEALGLLQPTNTPQDKKGSGSASTPSGVR